MSAAKNTMIYLGNDPAEVEQIFRSSSIGDMDIEAFGNVAALKHAMADQRKAALLIVDLNLLSNMPFNQIAQLQQLRTAISMMVLSGRFSNQAIELAIQFGFDEFVSQPLSRQVMAALAQKAIRKQGEADGNDDKVFFKFNINKKLKQ